jgi:hypothetical protein
MAKFGLEQINPDLAELSHAGILNVCLCGREWVWSPQDMSLCCSGHMPVLDHLSVQRFWPSHCICVEFLGFLGI